MLMAGFAQRDITPKPGVQLSGFVARCDAPSTRIDDPLSARVTALRSGENLTVIVSLDLLGLCQELNDRLLMSIENASHGRVRAEHVVLCCTHNHSGPATIELIGCGSRDLRYWDELCRAVPEAVVEAIDGLVPVTVSISRKTISGVSYNRRVVLSNGRVVMTSTPGEDVLRRGPDWPSLIAIRFDAGDGSTVAAVVSWAAHPCIVCSDAISADWPGEFCRRLSEHWRHPVMFLQGPCADINLPYRDMNRAEMLLAVDRLMGACGQFEWNEIDSSCSAVSQQTISLSVEQPSRKWLTIIRDGMNQIGRSDGATAVMAELANILNVEPGMQVLTDRVRHVARAMGEWAERLLNVDVIPHELPTQVQTLALGPLLFIFASTEMFVSTGLKLQAAAPDRIVVPVGYTGPLIGYLPPDQDLRDGGYEAAFAYRFYGAPGPFVFGSEERFIQAATSLIDRPQETVRARYFSLPGSGTSAARSTCQSTR